MFGGGGGDASDWAEELLYELLVEELLCELLLFLGGRGGGGSGQFSGLYRFYKCFVFAGLVLEPDAKHTKDRIDTNCHQYLLVTN